LRVPVSHEPSVNACTFLNPASATSAPCVAVMGLEHRYGSSVPGRVRQRQVDRHPVGGQFRVQVGTEAVHRPPTLLDDPHVGPTETAGPHLRERLLGSEAHCQARHDVGPTTQQLELFRVETAFEELHWSALVGAPYPFDLDHIDTHCDYHLALPPRSSRVPVAVATKARSAMPRNKPCSSTPGTSHRARASSAGLNPSGKLQSSTRLPLSLRNSSPPAMRTVGSAPRSSSRLAVRRQPKTATSTGRGALSPSLATCLVLSPMSTNTAAAAATTFSRSNAPPRPLMAL